VEAPFRLPAPLFILTGFGPALSALILVVLQEGGSGARALLERLAIVRVSWIWYGIVLAGPALLFTLALGIGALLGVRVDLAHPTVLKLVNAENGNPWILLVPAFLYLLVTLLGEEIGWRGYALPRLLRVQNELGASLVLGVFWGIWHLPLAWAPSLQAAIVHLPFGWFMVDIIATSILYTFVFVNTKKSLLIALLFHTANNLAAMYLPILPPAAPNSQLFFIVMALRWAFVAGLLAIKGSADWVILEWPALQPTANSGNRFPSQSKPTA
jgi:membrane protease YdiL (CAAX protease family)